MLLNFLHFIFFVFVQSRVTASNCVMWVFHLVWFLSQPLVLNKMTIQNDLCTGAKLLWVQFMTVAREKDSLLNVFGLGEKPSHQPVT